MYAAVFGDSEDGEGMTRDSLGDRMKARYENASRHYLPGRMPVILRVDGKAFHSMTRHCTKPFDTVLMTAMDATAKALCEQIQGAQLAYVQSDEISILIHNYKRLTSDAWFDNNIQKMVSVGASIATAAFNMYDADAGDSLNGKRWDRPAMFDARVFVVPEAEVCNAFLWRQQDAERNSIQMLARSLYSHRECENKNCAQLQDMCHAKGHNWNDLPTRMRRGRCVVRRLSGWEIDWEIPRFSQDRAYIERHLATESEEAA